MNFLRQIVSGPKNRYRQDGYNLDLTYVTPRIIAMAYPAEGLQKLYRNSIDTVSEFLQKNHEGKYLIVNISGRQINNEKLANIRSFHWQDHKTPQFQILFVICQIIMEHLSKDLKNVCVVHCNHGKGRTGTLICCFMLYTNYFQTAQEAMIYYQKQRFQKQGYGVTQPCQIKYIQYFNQILRRPKMFPIPLSLYKIEVKGEHSLKQPYFKVRGVEHNDYFINTKDEHMEVLEVQKQTQLVVKVRRQSFFIGDCVLQIKHNPVVGKKIAANYAFNTAFLADNYKKLQIGLTELSPLSSVKSGIFGKDFRLALSFKKLCNCSQNLQYEKRCSKCKAFLLTESKKWTIIYEIIDKKPQIDGKWILFGFPDKITKMAEFQGKPKTV